MTQLLRAAGTHASQMRAARGVEQQSAGFCCHSGHPADVQAAEGKAVEAKTSLPKKLRKLIAKVWLEHDAGTLANGSKLTMLHQLGTRGITAVEEQTAHHCLNQLAVEVDKAIARASGPWDEQLKQMGADCFLFAPEGPTPKQKARLLEMLGQVREGLNQPKIRIKLSDILSSSLAGYVNVQPVGKKPGGMRMFHRLNGLEVSKGDLHLARRYFSLSPGMLATLLHEITHYTAGTLDTGDQGKGDEPATRSYIDWARTLETGRFHYMKERTPDPELAPYNADALTWFIRTLAEKPKRPEGKPAKPAPFPAGANATKPTTTTTTATPATTKPVPPKIAQTADT